MCILETDTLLYGAGIQACCMRQKSKLNADEIKFVREKVGKKQKQKHIH
jgi:hypothetical protein